MFSTLELYLQATHSHGMRRRTTAAILLIVVVAVVGALSYLFLSSSSVPPLNTSPTPVTTTTFCSITGQAGGAFLRILSDSTQVPVVGAQVSAANKPAYCGSNSYTTDSPATSQTTITFTTNSTEWYSLNTLNNAGYSFVVKYSGQSYTLTIDLRPVSTTCATLLVPSGHTNSTITELQTAC